MSKLSYSGRSVNKVYNQDFIIDKRFKIVKELGHGAYGIVCSAKYEDENSKGEGNFVAIKKITNIFSKKILCKRSLRELKLLQFFRGHKNITCLYDLDIIPNPMTGEFNEVYLYEELMECDMHQIIRSGQSLTDQHYQSFIYQVLCGLKYIHSADVLHRDLKPGNLLVNADCDLKICDFGLARGFSENPNENAGFMTEYVATRWYRAPEIMLSFTNYTKAIDIWSVGCILAELLGGKPIFRGKDYVDQLNQILLILGTPKESTLIKIGSVRAQNYVRSLPFMRKVNYLELFPNANPLALDLLEKMLTLDPYERISVNEALEHPYFQLWHDPQDEPACQVKFDFKSFEQIDDTETMKKIIIDEVKNFREFVRRPIQEQHQIQLQLQLQKQYEQQLNDQKQKQQQQQQEQQEAQQAQQKEQQEMQQHLISHESNPSTIQSDIIDNFDGMDLATPYNDPSINQPTNSFSTGVNTSANISNDIQYYDSIPKPQELDEFSFNRLDDDDKSQQQQHNHSQHNQQHQHGQHNQHGQQDLNSDTNSKRDDNESVLDNNEDLFRLEEELGFGMDGNLFNNI